MRERCECGKANCVYCNPVDIPARPELLEQIEQLQAENQRLRAAIRKARNHQTEMGGSFNAWFHGIQTILGEALKGGE